MAQIVVLDARLLTQYDEEWRTTIVEACESAGFRLHLIKIPSKDKLHPHDFVSIVGVGAAVAGLVLRLFDLIKQPKETWSYSKLQAEISSYLKMRGVTDFQVLETTGFNNLTERNGMPCIVTLLKSDGSKLDLYVGVTSKTIVISPQPFDPRNF